MRGPAGCINRHGVSIAPFTDAVVASLQNVVLQESVLTDLLDTMAAAARKPDTMAAQRQAHTERLAVLAAELARAAEAFFTGPAPTVIVQAIKAREAEKRDLEAKLKHLEALADTGRPSTRWWTACACPGRS